MEMLTNKSETSLQVKQNYSPDLIRRANQIRKAYGEFESGFCVTFNTESKNRFPDLVSACMTHTPTLRDIDMTYGENSALTWMTAQLGQTLAFVGLSDAITVNQQVWCARNIIAIRPDVTVSEVLQFLTRFEQGRYYVFNGYKHPNPQFITASFSQFLDDLYEARGTAEQKKNHERIMKENERAKRNAVACPPEIAQRLKEAGLPAPGNNDK